MNKSVNKVFLVGRLTRNPELRHTTTNKAMCAFGLATNRVRTTETGEKQEESDFHRIVAWDKLAEVCHQYLRKGRMVHVEGRLKLEPTLAKTASKSTQQRLLRKN
jgi:single-strand DNA-binding protein